MHTPIKSIVVAAAVVAAGLTLTTNVTASAHPADADSVTQHMIADEAVGTRQVKDFSLRLRDTTPTFQDRFMALEDSANDQETRLGTLESAPDRLAELEADGPYPGATDLGSLPDQGDNSDFALTTDGTIQQFWVQCAPGKTALGGGFRVAADAGPAAAKSVQVTASEPTYVEDGALADGTIEGDAAMSIRPNGWLVEANSTFDASPTLIVRPWVICG